jgi:Flp pilus assembly pilin Flp
MNAPKAPSPRRTTSLAGNRRGQSLVEYTVLLALIGLVLVIGDDSPLEALFRAVQAYYGRFTFSLSMP